MGKHEAAIEGGLTNTMRWKWIDFGFTLTYSLGGDAFDYTHALYGGDGDYYYGSVPSYYKLEDMWQGPGDTDAKTAKVRVRKLRHLLVVTVAYAYRLPAPEEPSRWASHCRRRG